MKRPLVITLNVLSWTAILVYLLLSSRYTRERKQQRPCREVRVVVLDSAERGFITPAMVRGWFASEKIPLVGRELSSINTLELERRETGRTPGNGTGRRSENVGPSRYWPLLPAPQR